MVPHPKSFVPTKPLSFRGCDFLFAGYRRVALTMEPINLFIPTFRVEETLAQIRECLEKGWTGLGFKTVEFEEAWKQYTGLPHAHFLNSATAGLHLAVRLLKEEGKWEEGDEVITTPFTFVSTNHVILYENLRPVFTDIDEFLCLDPQLVREKITSSTRAVIFVGLGGNTGRMEEMENLVPAHGLKFILDASHMSGTRFRGRHVGGEADVSVFSFQAVKNLPTAESGMICFADAGLDTEVRKWTWLGIDKDTFSRTLPKGLINGTTMWSMKVSSTMATRSWRPLDSSP